MSSLQILMPMGGLGSRFAKEGYDTPKPLIEVDGKPMFMRALDSFKDIPNTQHIFVIRKEHDEKYDLKNQIKAQLPDARIALLNHDTDGAVETCLIAADLIDNQLPLAVADCDIYFESKAYFNKVHDATTNDTDGMLLTFKSNDDRYSYVELDNDGTVFRTAEKVVISNHAILGGYFFKNGELFKSLAEQFLSEGVGELKEFYMSHLFNILLARDGKVEIADVDTMHIFGTPEELTAYLNRTV